ncbi:hypothetical protein Z043_111005 [Scleropages formosus]|uniref:Uncharacterized protein n=1 Tax=Scleropages formosus TaxID=113540 RepID=A0A0P7V5Y9_SCLFO|nr:hypothetical protein Z043_111005 [Scleropages formosus]
MIRNPEESGGTNRDLFPSSRLALYVYEYLLHVGAQKSAQTFLSEVSNRSRRASGNRRPWLSEVYHRSLAWGRTASQSDIAALRLVVVQSPTMEGTARPLASTVAALAVTFLERAKAVNATSVDPSTPYDPAFLSFLQIRWEKNITLGEPPGFLHSWWWYVYKNFTTPVGVGKNDAVLSNGSERKLKTWISHLRTVSFPSRDKGSVTSGHRRSPPNAPRLAVFPLLRDKLVFWDLYCAAPDRRETCEHSSEAKAFHDYEQRRMKKRISGGFRVAVEGELRLCSRGPAQACIALIIFGPRVPPERQFDRVAAAALLITEPFPGVSAAQKEKNNQGPASQRILLAGLILGFCGIATLAWLLEPEDSALLDGRSSSAASPSQFRRSSAIQEL